MPSHTGQQRFDVVASAIRHYTAAFAGASRSTWFPCARHSANPPARLETFVNPFARSRLAAIEDRGPVWH